MATNASTQRNARNLLASVMGSPNLARICSTRVCFSRLGLAARDTRSACSANSAEIIEFSLVAASRTSNRSLSKSAISRASVSFETADGLSI